MVDKEACYYNKDGVCMLMILKKVKGAMALTQYCLGSDRMIACYRTREQVEVESETERIELKGW